ncbi:MAG: hypothetical protein ACFBSG_07485 [Leptolyngbyaceae cyanobacterium]
MCRCWYSHQSKTSWSSGGGVGGSVREIIKHDSVESDTMVEIDEAVVRASREYLPTLSSALDDPKLNLIIDDGIEFVRRAPADAYDFIVVDSSDPVGPSEGLFSHSFYRDIYRCLRPSGIMTAQSESPRFNQRAFVDLNRCLKDIFGPPSVHCYLAFIPTYPTGMWGFSFCAKGQVHPVQDLPRDRAAQFADAHQLQYYNAGIHQAAFCLPTFIQTLLNE